MFSFIFGLILVVIACSMLGWSNMAGIVLLIWGVIAIAESISG